MCILTPLLQIRCSAPVRCRGAYSSGRTQSLTSAEGGWGPPKPRQQEQLTDSAQDRKISLFFQDYTSALLLVGIPRD